MGVGPILRRAGIGPHPRLPKPPGLPGAGQSRSGSGQATKAGEARVMPWSAIDPGMG